MAEKRPDTREIIAGAEALTKKKQAGEPTHERLAREADEVVGTKKKSGDNTKQLIADAEGMVQRKQPASKSGRGLFIAIMVLLILGAVGLAYMLVQAEGGG